MKASLFFSLVGLLVCGCSSFNSQWRAAAQHPAASGDLAGRWDGSWKSDANGHHGKLRCLITRKGGEIYEAYFHAKYLKILSFSYTVNLQVNHQGDAFTFTGSVDLGSFGGVFNYDGHADATNFLSNYSSKHDHGTFQMTKVP